MVSDNAYKPTVVISLDYELRWGMHDRLGFSADAYRENIECENEIVRSLLTKLSQRNIRATWACVGAIGCMDWQDYFSRAPKPPRYADSTLAVDPRYADMDPDGRLHFAPKTLAAIYTTPGQELGTHTFSHLFLREPGVTAQDVRADLAAVARLWSERFGRAPVSLVFPRNQSAFLSEIRHSQIKIWRGNERPWYFDRNERSTNKTVPRALRLLDAVNPFMRRASSLEDDMSRATLFFRPGMTGLAWCLHLARIRHELENLRSGEIFHLWWHPHNLGRSLRRMQKTELVLDLIADHCAKARVVSRTMGDLVA